MTNLEGIDPLQNPKNIGEEYLRARGLTVNDIDRAGILIRPALTGAQAVGWLTAPAGSTSAIIIPYYTTTRDLADYVAVRFVGSTGAKLVVPRGRPRLYFPRILDWVNIPSGAELQIHESAIKAINAAKQGIYSIGLNGVECGVSEGEPLPEWDALPWIERALQPTIVFDSNINRGHAFNPRVRDAAVRLSAKLRLKYGERLNVWLRKIPDGPADSPKGWGFDDWVAACGATGRHKAVADWLARGPDSFNVSPWTEAVAHLNEVVVYVRALKRVATITPPHIFMTANEFTGAAYANRHYEGAGGAKPAARAWMAAEERNEVGELVYRPGQPKLEQYGAYLNLWTRMGLEPAAGDVGPFLDLLNNLMVASERDEFLRWVAWPLQNAGGKMHKAVLFVGESGVGKSFIAETISLIYGDNAGKVRNKDFQTSFNSNLAQKQFAHWEEANLGAKREEAKAAMEQVKDFVTGHELPVEFKGKDVIMVDNCCNLMILTNNWDKFPVQRGERRFFIVGLQQKVDRTRDTGYWRALIAWRDAGGAAALYDYLLAMNISAFEPYAPAMITGAFEDVRRESGSARTAWIEDHLGDMAVDLMTAAEIEAMFTASGMGASYESGAHGAKIMGNALRECGIQLAAEGTKFRNRNGVISRYYNIKRKGEYTRASRCREYIRTRGDVKVDSESKY